MQKYNNYPKVPNFSQKNRPAADNAAGRNKTMMNDYYFFLKRQNVPSIQLALSPPLG